MLAPMSTALSPGEVSRHSNSVGTDTEVCQALEDLSSKKRNTSCYLTVKTDAHTVSRMQYTPDSPPDGFFWFVVFFFGFCLAMTVLGLIQTYRKSRTRAPEDRSGELPGEAAVKSTTALPDDVTVHR